MMVLEGRSVPSIFPEAQRAGEGFDSDIIWSDVGYGIVPIGGIVAWMKTLCFGTSAELLIPNFLECNGQVVADGGSPFDGMALPDLRTGQILKGNTTSGTTGGASTHAHTVPASSGDWGLHGSYTATSLCVLASGANSAANDLATSGSSDTNNMPAYYTLVFMMKVKIV